MVKFPNKVIQKTYMDAIGKVFRHRPTAQKFVDENENTNYNYSAMVWLLHNKILEESFNLKKIVCEYRIVR